MSKINSSLVIKKYVKCVVVTLLITFSVFIFSVGGFCFCKSCQTTRNSETLPVSSEDVDSLMILVTKLDSIESNNQNEGVNTLVILEEIKCMMIQEKNMLKSINHKLQKMDNQSHD